jgi:cathepsin B
MRTLIIWALALLIKCNSREESFLQLPFDVDWRESSYACLDSQRHPVETKQSYLAAVEELVSIKVCLQSRGEKLIEYELGKTIECEKERNLEGKDYITFLEENGALEKNCLKNLECINICQSDQTKRVFANNVKTFNREGIIMQEILFNGPVIATFDLYSDFLEYKGGVYVQQSGDYMGRHSVLLIGFVREGQNQYWIAKNSFGPQWGEGGYFRIPFDHLGICESVKTFTPLYK